MNIHIFKKNLPIIMAGIFALVNAYPSFAATELYLGLKKTGSKKIGAAVTNIVSKGGGQNIEYLSKEVSGILKNDLILSGVFELLENSTLIKEMDEYDKTTGEIRFSEWKNIGVTALLKGEYSFENGMIVLTFSLYDTFEKKELLNRKYSTKMRDIRKAVHQFSDEVVYIFTGEYGVASTKIAFISLYGGKKEVYMMDSDGYNLERLSYERSITLSPAWSPDAKYVAFTSYKYNNPDLFIINAENYSKRVLSNRKGLNATPAWSHNGEYIAITLSLNGNSDIYKVNTDGSNLQKLTNSRGIDTSPAWSADDKSIAFVSDRSGRPLIYIMDLDGKKEDRRINHVANECQAPDWSRKDNKIVYSCRQQNNFDIYIYDLSKESYSQITNSSGNNENPSWSPDGRHIVFESDRSGKHQLYMMHADGTEQQKIIDLEVGGYNPTWSGRLDYNEIVRNR